MLTLYYSPQTRATRIVGLLMHMNRMDDVDIKTVHVARRDGAGGHDPANPHPEGKVPLLVHDGEVIRESNAIILYLTDHFGGSMGRAVGEKGRGEYLSWLAYYGNIVEPLMILQYLSMDKPAYANVFDEVDIKASLRGPEEVKNTLVRALADRPFLMGDQFTAVDLLLVSPYQWFPPATPDHPLVHDWVKRCGEAADIDALMAFEAAAMKDLGVE